MEWKLQSDLPIYTQLVETIKLAILSGELPPGAKLAPVRELAMEAGVNPNTMQRAMQELEREGLVFPLRTVGRFVTQEEAVIEAVKRELAGDKLRRFLADMAKLGYDRSGAAALLNEVKEDESDADPGM